MHGEARIEQHRATRALEGVLSGSGAHDGIMQVNSNDDNWNIHIYIYTHTTTAK